jgi:hypothetical protein
LALLELTLQLFNGFGQDVVEKVSSVETLRPVAQGLVHCSIVIAYVPVKVNDEDNIGTVLNDRFIE